MPRFITTLCFLAVTLAVSGPAMAQGWIVYSTLEIFETAVPQNSEADLVALSDQPKIASYPELIAVSGTLGNSTVAYDKDADPFGEFSFTVTNDLAGEMNAFCVVGHGIETVEGAGWKVQCTLTVELIDRNGGGARLRVGSSQDLMRMNVQDLGNTYSEVEGMAIGEDLDLQVAGMHSFDAGVLAFEGPAIKAMEAVVEFRLSAGDQAVLVGRFELSQELTPVEQQTWSGVKSLFR